MPPRDAGVLALVLFAVSSPAPVRACAACACGDPTLTVMGAQQPFEGRLRVALDLQYRSDALGRDGVDRVELNEERMTLSVAYAPSRWLMLSLAVPTVRREISDVTLATDTVWGLSDLELRARAFVFRDRALAPRHLLALVGGVRVPTGRLERDASGEYRAPELQVGTGSFDPLGGVSYAFFADPWSLYASEIVYVPTQGPADFRVGTSLRGTHAVQYQVLRELALRAGVDFRLEAASTRGAADEPDSGGLILFAAPALIWSPAMDLVLSLDVHIPLWNALTGRHDEGVFAMLGAAYDVL